LRLSINHVAKEYGEGTIYFDSAVVRDIYLPRYMEIEAESHLPEAFWDKYKEKS